LTYDKKIYISDKNVRRFYAVSKTYLHSHYIFLPLSSKDSRKGITINSALWGVNGDSHKPKSFYMCALKQATRIIRSRWSAVILPKYFSPLLKVNLLRRREVGWLSRLYQNRI